MNHVARGTTQSPFISLTLSFGIACQYARAGRRRSGSERPYVYQIELPEHLLLDPVVEVSRHLEGAAFPYQHDGLQQFILGVADPKRFGRDLDRKVSMPPGSNATPRQAKLSIEYETLVRALRDAELLAIAHIPKYAVVCRYEA